MFSLITIPFARFLPRIELSAVWRRRSATHQNHLDLEEMSDYWQRDIGLLDGREIRGRDDRAALRAARPFFVGRSL